mgnify:CR=1 FL=1
MIERRMFGFNRSATVHRAWLGEKVKSKRAGKQKTSRFFKLFHVKQERRPAARTPFVSRETRRMAQEMFHVKCGKWIE